jgi:hypothetical protein
MNRLIGIITFKPPVYREVAHDPAALTPAAIVVVVVTVVTALLSGLLGTNPLGLAAIVATSLTTVLVSWLLASALTAFIANRLFRGQSSTAELLRIFGFTYAFQLLIIVPFAGAIAAAILSIIATVLAIRESAGFDTQKAIFTAIISGVILLVLNLVIASAIGGIFGAALLGS